MKNGMKKYWLVVATSILLLTIIGAKKATYDNEKFLVNLAEFSDIPSWNYYLAVERIFELSEKRNVEEVLEKYILNDQMEYLHNEFIHLTGIIGTPRSPSFLIGLFKKYKETPDKKAIYYYIIESMGDSGNEAYSPFLEDLLRNYEEHELPVPIYFIQRSYYLITGINYEQPSNNGYGTHFPINPTLEKSREAIINSKGRKRTVEEMITIDNVGRSEEWVK